jgi:hypothetical protein
MFPWTIWNHSDFNRAKSRVYGANPIEVQRRKWPKVGVSELKRDTGENSWDVIGVPKQHFCIQLD